MAEIRTLKDLDSGAVFFPATIGEAVAVNGKKLTAHIKRIDTLEADVSTIKEDVKTLRKDLDNRTLWYKE